MNAENTPASPESLPMSAVSLVFTVAETNGLIDSLIAVNRLLNDAFQLDLLNVPVIVPSKIERR